MIIDRGIQEAYTGLSVLLVFVSILFEMKAKKAEELLGRKISKEKKIEIKSYKNSIKTFLKLEWGWLVCTFTMLVFILANISVKILNDSHIDFINFNITRTIFIFTMFIVLYFYGVIVQVSFKLINKIIRYEGE